MTSFSNANENVIDCLEDAINTIRPFIADIQPLFVYEAKPPQMINGDCEFNLKIRWLENHEYELSFHINLVEIKDSMRRIDTMNLSKS